MAALRIRNLDDAVIEGLRRRALRNHRSLEGELRSVLEQAAFSAPTGSTGSRRTRLRLKTVSVGRKSRYGRSEIYGVEER